MTKPSFTREAIDMLLTKLSSDDQFREHMERDPVAALQLIGITTDASKLPAVRKLPSKEKIHANRTALSDKLHGECGHNPLGHFAL